MPILKKTVPVMLLLAVSSVAHAQVDSMQVLVPQLTATGASGGSPGAIFAAAYDSASDTAYVSIVSPVLTTARIRRITNVSTSPLSTTMITDSQLNGWLQNGENRTGSGLPQGLTFNPAPVGSVPTAGNLWLSDTATISPNDGSAASSINNDPAASQRIYRYNLQDVPGSGSTIFSNMSQVMMPVIAKSHKQIAAGLSPSADSDSSGRQAVFSPDGQQLYLQDSSSSSSISGIYRIDPINPGNVVRITSATVSSAAEPAVAKVGSLDRIYFRSSNTPSGLTYIDHNPATNSTSAETVLLTATQLQDFLETSSAPSITSVATDAAGNVYLNDSTTARMLKLDPQGRLVKLTTRAERANVLGLAPTAPGTNMAKLQTYTFAHPTAGSITRAFYDEIVYGLGVVNVFKPADFNRNGSENADDMSLFKIKLAPIGVSSAIADARFDMNGNGQINYKDVKILQSFYGFRNGDANMDKKVDTLDFNSLAGNFGKGSLALWTEGDFDGNEMIESQDFNILIANYAQPPLSAPSLGSVVPEPASGGLLMLSAGAMIRRRR